MPDDDTVDPPSHCHGCGRDVESCRQRTCGRSGPEDPVRFCSRCGWRLREIAVVPGVGSLWCRVHGAIPG